MGSWIKSTEIDAILNSSEPSVDLLLHSSDVQSVYRMGNQKLVKFLSKESSIEKLIKILHTSQEFPIIRRIFGLFSSPNTTLLKEVIYSTSHLEHLLSILEKTETVHRYVIGVIANVLLKAFDLSKRDFFNIIKQSKLGYIRLIKCLDIPSVFHFLNHVVSCSEIEIYGQSLIWLIFLVLMGSHGPGAKIPSKYSNDPCIKSKLFQLHHVQRMRCLDLLCSFFNEFVEDETDLFKAVNKGLPLLLQDSFDDEERSLVFKLGLILNPNEALAIAAVSILNCFKSSDLLIQFSLLYIAAFDVKIGARSIELFLYRLLSKSRNNFVMIAAAKMLVSAFSLEKDMQLYNNLRIIICDGLSGDKIKDRAYKSIFLAATECNEIDPENIDSAKLINKYSNLIVRPNQALISSLKQKAAAIDTNNEFIPRFIARELWPRDELTEMEKTFKTIDQIPIERPRPKPIITTQYEEEIELVELEVSPPPPNLRRRQRKESSSDEDSDVLEEIEVTEKYPARFPPSPGRPCLAEDVPGAPLTIAETEKEPLPPRLVPRELKPTPKVPILSPASPRIAHRHALSSLNFSGPADGERDFLDPIRLVTPKRKRPPFTDEKGFSISNKTILSISPVRCKTSINKRVLVVEVPETKPTLNLCTLSTFEDYPGKIETPTDEEKKHKRRKSDALKTSDPSPELNSDDPGKKHKRKKRKSTNPK